MPIPPPIPIKPKIQMMIQITATNHSKFLILACFGEQYFFVLLFSLFLRTFIQGIQIQILCQIKSFLDLKDFKYLIFKFMWGFIGLVVCVPSSF